MKQSIENRHNRWAWLRGGLGAAALAGLVSCVGGADEHDLKLPADPDVTTPGEEGKPTDSTKALPYKPGKILVRFKRDAGATVQAAAHDSFGARMVHSYKYVSNLQVVELPEDMPVERAIELYKRNPNVLYAEPNLIYKLNQTFPDDTLFGDMFGLHNEGQTGGLADADIDAPEAWDITQGSPDVILAVLDSGFDYLHSDLAANAYVNLAELEGEPGVDDDGNGYIDDIHGINTIDETGDPFPYDGDEHGTHVAGTIAAAGNNGAGVVGVNWEAKIVACKAFSLFATLEDIMQCMDYFLDLKTRTENPANILASNNSWGGGGFSQALLDTIEAHNAAGMLFIAAAGNDGSNTDLSPHFPSSYEATNIISVLATNHNDERAFFSNFGALSVDVGAPGEAILSTTPGDNFAVFSGTSMATPHVTGLVGLIKAADPTRTAAQIKNLVLTGGDVTPGTDGLVLTGRRINAFGSLTCTDQVLNNRFSPAGDSVIVGTGTPVVLGVLSINCDEPNPASFVVNVVETGQSIPLVDASGSGEFTAQFVPTEIGNFTLEFVQGGEVIDTVFVSTIGNYDPPRLLEGQNDCRTIEGTPLPLTDDSAAEVISDFPIQFAGAAPGLGSVFVGSNGVLSFSGPVTSFSNQALPTTLAETIVAPFWDDFNPSARGEVLFETIGEAPNRELVIEYRDVPHYFDSGLVTFQAVFFENSPNILFNYCDVTFEDAPNFDGGASATIGVQVTTDVAQQFSFNTPSVADGDSVIFTMGAPFAVAGPDQVVLPGTDVTLDGSASEDLDGVLVRHTWTQLAGEPVDLIGADSPVATFTAPQSSGTVTFELEVEDDEGQTGRDTVDVIINLAPVADAGPDFVVGTNLAGTLDCSASTDSDGTIVGYQWVQLGGDPVDMVNDGTAVATFTAPATEQFLVFQCTVVDDLGFTDSDVVVGDVFFNAGPTAEAGNDQVVLPGGTVALDATASSDADGTIAAYNWETIMCMTIDGPCEIEFDDPTSVTPVFTAPASAGFAYIAVTVTDDIGATDTDTTVISFARQAPEVVATADPECVSPGDLVTLSAACVDPDGTVASLEWAQTGGVEVVLSGAAGDTASFTAPSTVEPLAFQVTCTDNDGLTSSANVSVSITAEPVAVAACSPAGVFEGGTVSCNGSGSQNAIDFTWSSPTDPGVSIPPGETTSFVAPDVSGFRIVEVQLTVSNECGGTASDVVEVVVVSAD